jgi:Phage terminase large subunit (GpA)
MIADDDNLHLDIHVEPSPPPAAQVGFATDQRSFADAPAPSAARPRACSLQTSRPQTVSAWLRAEVFAPCYREIIPSRTVWQWADDNNVYLDSRSTAQPQWYASRQTPWTRAFMETATDPRWREDHVMKSSRVGFTEAGLNILRFMPEHMAGQALYAIDSAKEVKSISIDRLIPTLRNLPNNPLTADPDDVSQQRIRLRAMTIHLAGSYSEGTFRNKYLRVAILDEVEAVDGVLEEGSLHDMARSRQNDVPDAKLFSLSKPVEWRSDHHKEVVSGTLEAYLVPCPHCGTFQELSRDGSSPTHSLRIEGISRPLRDPAGNSLSPPRCGRLIFDHAKDILGEWDYSAVEASTTYECVACATPIREHDPLPPDAARHFPGDDPVRHAGAIELRARLATGETLPCKASMVLAGQWLQTNPRPIPRKRSRHISDLYSLHAEVSWGKLARIFLQARADPDLLKHAINNHDGLPYRPAAAEITDEMVLECRSPYRRSHTPFVPHVCILGADTQDAVWKYTVAAFRLTGEVAVVRYGMATSPAELIAELDSPVLLENDPNRAFPLLLGFVDAGGHRTEEVYDLFYASHRRLLSCYGRPKDIAVRSTVWKGQTTHRLRPHDIYFAADVLLKRRLYLGHIARVREIRAALQAHAGGTGPSLRALGLPQRLHLPAQPHDAEAKAYFSELAGESQRADGTWEKVKGRHNDYGDSLKYALAAFDHLQPMLLAQAHADLLEARKKADAPAITAALEQLTGAPLTPEQESDVLVAHAAQRVNPQSQPIAPEQR